MKKLLAALLAAVLALSLGVVALADDTLPAAVDGVVKLTGDVTVGTLDTNMTYDLNGYTLTYTGGSVQPTNGQVLSFIDTSVSGSKRGGTLLLSYYNPNDTYYTTAILCPLTGGTVNASNIIISAPQCSAFFPAGDAAAVNITNCDVTSGCYGVGTNAGNTNNYNVAITIKGSNITTTTPTGDNAAVLLNVPGTLNIEDSVITGDRQAVFVRAGTATIKDSEIIVTGKYPDHTQYQSGNWSSGTEAPASALITGNLNGNYNANAIVTVENTVITSQNAEVPAIYTDANSNYSQSLSISGSSEVNGSVQKGQYTEEGNTRNKITITGGTFSDENVTDFVPAEYAVASVGADYIVGAENIKYAVAYADPETKVEMLQGEVTLKNGVTLSEGASYTVPYPPRDTVTIEIGGDKEESKVVIGDGKEENPNTGAPVFVGALVGAAAAAK